MGAAASTVLCLHASGASSRQWEPLAVALAPRWRVLAPDLVAHGRARAWRPGEAPSLDAEVDALASLLLAQPGPLHVVGHSYGAAVAMRLAVRHPARVASLALFEPVLFRATHEARPRDPGPIEAILVAGELDVALGEGRPASAARIFVDYWSGTGTWDAMDERARAKVTSRMPAVKACFDALLADATVPEQLQRVHVPALLMSGGQSPTSGRSCTQWLASMLPRARHVFFPALGHMGPLEQPAQFADCVARFLALAAGARQDRSPGTPAPARQAAMG